MNEKAAQLVFASRQYRHLPTDIDEQTRRMTSRAAASKYLRGDALRVYADTQ